MKIKTELQATLYKDYNVYYNDILDAWTRSEGKWNRKDFELGIVTELITGDNILKKGGSYVDYQEHREPGSICVCGCPLCRSLYRLYHKATDTCFLVGSKCVERAGHTNFISDLECGQRNGFCSSCGIPLRFKGLRKNSLKSYKGICSGCRKSEKVLLNISYHDKDKYRQYGTRWDPDIKSWYWIGFLDKFPIELEKVKR